MRKVARTLARRAPRWLGLALMLGLLTCGSEELVTMKNDLTQFKQSVDRRLTQQQLEISLLREEDKKIWRSQRCKDTQVSDFMAEVEQCERGECPQRNLDRVLGFMVSQTHVLIRLRPSQTVADIAPSRVTQLRDALEQRQLTGVSRLLMLTMQLNLGREEPADLAEKHADALLMHIRRTLQLASNVPRIGPFPVTCQNKSQLIEGYARRFPADRAVAGEPKAKEPQVAIWIFKVDC